MPADLDAWVTWCSELPKVELHAHLNGCVRPSTLCELAIDDDKLGKGSDDVIMSNINKLGKSENSLQLGFQLFDMIHKVTNTLDIIARITRETIEDCAIDNVKYLELRTTPRNISNTTMNKRSYIETVLSVIQNTSKQHDVVVGLLLSINRNESSDEAMNTVNLAIEYCNKGVCGIDLSGNPHVGDFSTFRPALEHAKKNGLKTTLHFAEVYKPSESKAMLDFRPDRLGHVCYIDEELKKQVLSSGIPIEICLTSNVLTKSVSGYNTHHFKDFFDLKHPVSLCTDDYGIMSTTLSREYGLAAQHFKLSYTDIKTLVLSSIEQCFADASVKTLLREKVLLFFNNLQIIT